MLSKRDAEGVDNLKEIEEAKPTALESCIDQVTISSETCSSNGSKATKETSTQTSLTMLRYLIQASSDKHFVDSTTSPMRFERMSEDKVKNLRGNTNPFPRMFVENQMSITVSPEATMQATGLRPSRIRTPRDVLQVSTSFLSNNSGIKNEVLTITTDYGSSSTDTRSTLADAINQNGNRALHLSLQETYAAAPVPMPPLRHTGSRNNLFRRRLNHRSWNVMGLFNSCLRCVCTVNNESDTHPYVRGAPPAYSTMYANHRTTMRNWRPFRSESQPSFVAPVPPPSYAQAQQIRQASCSLDDLLSPSFNTNRNRIWASRPVTAICPRCTTIIVTTIEVRQSMITHIAALALFLCGCWPCCMIPYCLNSCKNIDHRCPVCRAYLGTYRPW
ncbi:uncharacterized protein LOC117604270 [Osmia lignaria lignaria]|uniref:uncharacterized protein LOC117604270 n=1 Tax=Osmia lignaria lignaria TaxID=1437193 RepID=UPI00402B4143